MAAPRPAPAQYQPRLTPWGHAWRLLLSLVIGGLLVVLVDLAGTTGPTPEWKWALDLALGATGLALVLLRRRWPLGVAVVLTLATCVSASVAGPATLAVVSLATRRRVWQVVAVGVLTVVCAHVFAWYFRLVVSDPIWIDVVTNIAFATTVLAWGMYVGSRRELLWTLRERARRAETEQELRVDQARGGERARIAREMHDVLAHRISQISMRAGALAFREDLGPRQMRENARDIQAKANEALTDLRVVLGVLRDSDTGEALDRPQPTLVDLPGLVEEAAAGGMHVEHRLGVGAPDGVPQAVGRTVYRIVQEGLTNARKHAPGARAEVTISGSPAEGITVQVRNPLGFPGNPTTPGAGLGLVGLAERTELRGGRLRHGPDGADFVLEAWLPWSP